MVNNTHAEMRTAPANKTNIAMLTKLKETFLNNTRHMAAFSKYFSFGKGSTQLNLTFAWSDSFDSRKKVSSKQPLLDQISSLYNYAVCLARMSCYGDLSGDGIKIASLNFQQAAWIFNHLLGMLSQLPEEEKSLDFNKETLM